MPAVTGTCVLHTKRTPPYLAVRVQARKTSSEQGKVLVKNLKIRNIRFLTLYNNFVFFSCVLLGAINPVLQIVGTLRIKTP